LKEHLEENIFLLGDLLEGICVKSGLAFKAMFCHLDHRL